MKKKLEADLISIAHRILKLKNKSDINQLYLETQKLYEKLTVLKFVEENFNTLKPTIGQSEITSELETIFEKEDAITSETQIEAPFAEKVIALEESYEPETTKEIIEPVVEKTEEPITAEVIEQVEEVEEVEEPVAEQTEEPLIAEVVEPVVEETEEPVVAEISNQVEEEVEKTTDKNKLEEFSFTTVSDLKPIPDFKPAFELDKEEIKEDVKEEPKVETESKSGPITISFEDFGINYADAQFVKVDNFENLNSTPTPPITEFKEIKTPVETAVLETPTEQKTVTLNEKLAKGFHVDLNDRIAFTKNLFGNSTEDYSRVLNQLLTFDSFGEAKEFIENMVKPDYNNWEGKDDYAERFLAIIEKKFS